MPLISNAVVKNDFNKELYKQRNIIERFLKNIGTLQRAKIN